MSKVGWGLCAVVALGAVLAGVAQAGQPNSGCHKSKWSDMMVCGNPNLADLDGKVNKAYKQARQSLSPQDAEEARQVQQAWVRGREKCQHDADPTKCLETYYQRRIKDLVQPAQ